jgi:hypothetical protein
MIFVNNAVDSLESEQSRNLKVRHFEDLFCIRSGSRMYDRASVAAKSHHLEDCRLYVNLSSPLYVSLSSPLYLSLSSPLYVSLSSPLYFSLSSPLYVSSTSPLHTPALHTYLYHLLTSSLKPPALGVTW